VFCLRIYATSWWERFCLEHFNTRAIFIPENKKLDNLLKDFQRIVILPLWWMNTGNSGLVSLGCNRRNCWWY
jgi:Mg2+/Co2+ transporter CorC